MLIWLSTVSLRKATVWITQYGINKQGSSLEQDIMQITVELIHLSDLSVGFLWSGSIQYFVHRTALQPAVPTALLLKTCRVDNKK